MLESPEPSQRGNAAMLLGLAGNRSAIPMLSVLGRQALPATVSPVRGVIVRIQVAEALVRLGDESGLSMIRGGLYSSYDEVRVLAAAMIGRLCDDRMEEALFGIIDDKRESTIELRLAAIEALARLERNLIVVKETLDRADLAVSVANGGAPALRAQAAQALGALERARQRGLASLHGLQSTPPQNIGQRFEQTGTAAALLQLLADESEQVRLAAAAAILEPRGS